MMMIPIATTTIAVRSALLSMFPFRWSTGSTIVSLSFKGCDAFVAAFMLADRAAARIHVYFPTHIPHAVCYPYHDIRRRGLAPVLDPARHVTAATGIAVATTRRVMEESWFRTRRSPITC